MKALSVLAIALLIVGCATTIPPYQPSTTELAQLKTKKPLVLCECGEIKGSKNCCKSGFPVDDETGFHPGSMRHRIIMTTQGELTKEELDCLYSKNNITLCKSCGHIKGTSKCCRHTAPKCKKCGFDTNSLRYKLINKAK
jgi:hypothetical protein